MFIPFYSSGLTHLSFGIPGQPASFFPVGRNFRAVHAGFFGLEIFTGLF
jgi:hypothetical protein